MKTRRFKVTSLCEHIRKREFLKRVMNNMRRMYARLFPRSELTFVNGVNMKPIRHLSIGIVGRGRGTGFVIIDEAHELTKGGDHGK